MFFAKNNFAFCIKPYTLKNWWQSNETCFDGTSQISAYSKNYLKIFNSCTSLSSIDFFEKIDGSKLQKCLAMGAPLTSDRLEHPCIDSSEQFAVE